MLGLHDLGLQDLSLQLVEQGVQLLPGQQAFSGDPRARLVEPQEGGLITRDEVPGRAGLLVLHRDDEADVLRQPTAQVGAQRPPRDLVQPSAAANRAAPPGPRRHLGSPQSCSFPFLDADAYYYGASWFSPDIHGSSKWSARRRAFILSANRVDFRPTRGGAAWRQFPSGRTGRSRRP